MAQGMRVAGGIKVAATQNPPTMSVVVRADDPRKTAIWDDIDPWIDNILPLGTEVLVCVYKESETLGIKGLDGNYLVKTDTAKAEYKFQGKVGMVVAMGDAAFVEDATHRWGDRKPKVGDWVIANVSEGWPCDIGPKSYGKDRFRFIEDVNVKSIVLDPDLVR